MQTYYKHDNGTFIPATISSEDAIAILIQSAVTDTVKKVNDIITNAVIARVNAVSDANIQSRVASHLETSDITNIVDEAVGESVRNYDYDGVIDNALDGVDIDEMVRDKIDDYLGDCDIKISIN
jgi:hypothetical protein